MNLKLENIYKVEDGTKLKGSASVIIDDCFKITGIKIIDGKDGLFLAMPNRVLSDGSKRDIVYPLNKETRELFNKVIIDAYNNLEK